MINYKEKYLKYKKKYLKIRKMFGGSEMLDPIKKVATIEPYSIPRDPLFQDTRKRMDIEYDNSANDEVRTQEMEAVRHAVLPLAVLDEIFAKGGLEKTRVKGKYKSNNSNSNKNSLLFGGGILIAAITSVVLLLK